MVNINVKLDDRVLKEARKAQEIYGAKVIKRAERDAAKEARTVLKENICERYKMKKNDTGRAISVQNGNLCAESRKLTVGRDTHFSHTPAKYKSQEGIAIKRRRKATATIIKGEKKKYKHGFILNPEKVKNGPKIMLWQRKGNQPPEPVKSVSVAEMANQKQIADKVQETMTRAFKEGLHRYIDREMSKIANH